jgi:hypothetical protein
VAVRHSRVFGVGATMAKLVWRVKLIAELEPGIMIEIGR